MYRCLLGLGCLIFAGTASAGTVTAAIKLERGAIVQEDDLNVSPPSGDAYQQALHAYVGKEMKRTIAAGYKLNPAYVGKPVLVRRNSRVNMIYRHGRMEIKAWGRALDEGGVGDVITILNLDSRKKVQGTVLKSGIVEVGL